MPWSTWHNSQNSAGQLFAHSTTFHSVSACFSSLLYFDGHFGILQVPQLTQESSYKCQDGRHNLQDCILQDWPKGSQWIWVRVFITSSRLGIHDSTWTTKWHSFEELRLNHCMSVQTNLLVIPKGIKKLRNTQTYAQEEWSEVRK